MFETNEGRKATFSAEKCYFSEPQNSLFAMLFSHIRTEHRTGLKNWPPLIWRTDLLPEWNEIFVKMHLIRYYRFVNKKSICKSYLVRKPILESYKQSFFDLDCFTWKILNIFGSFLENLKTPLFFRLVVCGFRTLNFELCNLNFWF